MLFRSNASLGCKEKACQKEPGGLAQSSPSHQQEGRGAGAKHLAGMLLLPKKKEMAMAGPKSQAGAGRNASPGYEEQACQKEAGSLAESCPEKQQQGRGGLCAPKLLLPEGPPLLSWARAARKQLGSQGFSQ